MKLKWKFKIQADLARPPAPTLQQNLENLFTHQHCPGRVFSFSISISFSFNMQYLGYSKVIDSTRVKVF